MENTWRRTSIIIASVCFCLILSEIYFGNPIIMGKVRIRNCLEEKRIVKNKETGKLEEKIFYVCTNDENKGTKKCRTMWSGPTLKGLSNHNFKTHNLSKTMKNPGLRDKVRKVGRGIKECPSELREDGFFHCLNDEGSGTGECCVGGYKSKSEHYVSVHNSRSHNSILEPDRVAKLREESRVKQARAAAKKSVFSFIKQLKNEKRFPLELEGDVESKGRAEFRCVMDKEASSENSRLCFHGVQYVLYEIPEGLEVDPGPEEIIRSHRDVIVYQHFSTSGNPTCPTYTEIKNPNGPMVQAIKRGMVCWRRNLVFNKGKTYVDNRRAAIYWATAWRTVFHFGEYVQDRQDQPMILKFSDCVIQKDYKIKLTDQDMERVLDYIFKKPSIFPLPDDFLPPIVKTFPFIKYEMTRSDTGDTPQMRTRKVPEYPVEDEGKKNLKGRQTIRKMILEDAASRTTNVSYHATHFTLYDLPEGMEDPGPEEIIRNHKDVPVFHHFSSSGNLTCNSYKEERNGPLVRWIQCGKKCWRQNFLVNGGSFEKSKLMAYEWVSFWRNVTFMAQRVEDRPGEAWYLPFTDCTINEATLDADARELARKYAFQKPDLIPLPNHFLQIEQKDYTEFVKYEL